MSCSNHICFIAIFFLFSTRIYGIDLAQVYQLAEKNDPTYLQEITRYESTLESRPQALSQLLPNISLSTETTYFDQNISSEANFGSSGRTDYNNRGYALNITQPIYRRDRWVALNQSDKEIQQATVHLTDAKQQLMMRVAERYLAYLLSVDNLNFTKVELKSLSRQLDQAKQRFTVGLNAITDVQEAKAAYDLAVFSEIQSIHAMENAKDAVREITGQPISNIDGLNGNTITLRQPDPNDIDSWTKKAIEKNLRVMAAHHAAAIQRDEIKRQFAGHYPNLDLIASHGYNSSGGRFGSNKTHSQSVGIRLEMPIYTGGFINSKTRQAQQNYNTAIHALDQARRAAERSAREAYLGVISGISQVEALQQAVISSETALKATEAGFEVGTRTSVDVIRSQRTASEAKRDYSQAKYAYLLNTLRLKQVTGILSIDDLMLINAYFTKE